MMINGGLGLAGAADGTMIESYVCSWAWKGRRRNWEQLKRTAQEYAPYVQSGGVVVALSYLGETLTTVKDDAFFCFAAARLSDFIWSDYQTLRGDPATVLYRAHLGPVVAPLSETAPGVDYRWFRDGLIVINGTDKPADVAIAAPGNVRGRSLRDLYADRVVPVSSGTLALSIPAQSGRVYRAQP
jgi:hypothetical protein